MASGNKAGSNRAGGIEASRNDAYGNHKIGSDAVLGGTDGERCRCNATDANDADGKNASCGDEERDGTDGERCRRNAADANGGDVKNADCGDAERDGTDYKRADNNPPDAYGRDGEKSRLWLRRQGAQRSFGCGGPGWRNEVDDKRLDEICAIRSGRGRGSAGSSEWAEEWGGNTIQRIPRAEWDARERMPHRKKSEQASHENHAIGVL